MSSWPVPPPFWGQQTPDGQWWFNGQRWVPRERLFPAWIVRPLVVWTVLLLAAFALWLARLGPSLNLIVGYGALLATACMGGVVGWHRHWRVLPLLALEPPFVLFLAWFVAWLIDPVDFGYFILGSVFLAFDLALVAYPLSLGLLAAGGGVAAVAARLWRAKERPLPSP